MKTSSLLPTLSTLAIALLSAVLIVVCELSLPHPPERGAHGPGQLQ